MQGIPIYGTRTDGVYDGLIQGSGSSIQGGGIAPMQGSVGTSLQGSSLPIGTVDPMTISGEVAGASTTNNQITQPDPGALAAAAAAAEAAEKAAKLQKARSGVISKLDAYGNLFGGLFGKMDTAVADQQQNTREAYGGQRNDLTEQYNTEVPNIDMSYYLGGIGDSSLRLAGQGRAEQAFKSGIGQIQNNEDTDLATIGQTYATKKAGYEADRSNIDIFREQVDQIEDPAELLSLQNSIQQKISGLTADTAGFDTQAGFKGQLAAAAPVKDLGPIRSTLQTLMRGAANPALKRQIGQQIIDNSGAPDEQKKELYDQYINSPVA